MTQTPHANPLIVGIGASAGGLKAFSTFLDHMPADSGMAFVLVQHLDPKHHSMLVDLLGPHTTMPVTIAEDGVLPGANQVHVIAPDSTLTIETGRLRVSKPAPPRERRRPIDTFFESLAKDQGENAVCVILSGTGSDGTRGMKAVKAAGGLSLAQAESDHTAMSGMPESAVATGRVDHVLPVADMPALLSNYHSHMSTVAQRKNGDGERTDASDHLSEICRLVKSRTGHDFSGYKDNTRIRRIQRRMQVLQIDDMDDYVTRLRAESRERDALFREFLIGVTGFFRDPAAWDAFAQDIVPSLLEGKNDAIRVWVAGCGTGEEAYSLAVLLKNTIADSDCAPALQIFATDIDAQAIETARAGWYSETALALPQEDVQRWFTPHSGGDIPSRELRDSCIFSVHDLARDPPFSRLDLVLCRNVLIYMERDLQERILRKFHYALLSDRYLFLGLSESIAQNSALFATLDKKHRLFQRLDANLSTRADLSLPTPPHDGSNESQPVKPAMGEDEISQAVRQVMAPHAPAYIVVDQEHRIQRFSGGSAGHYLEPADGAASLSLFDLLKRALRPAAREALQSVFQRGESILREDLVLRVDGARRRVALIAEPLTAGGANTLCVLAFRDAGPAGDSESVAPDGQRAGSAHQEQELQVTRTQLRAANTELERAREETRSVTEEYQSVNEELQSSNEELETSKEEMQSINEELQTVNAELSSKNERLTRVNSDLRNLLEATRIATIFLDNELRIKNFTPCVSDLFYLRDGDYGRPITELASRLNYDHVEDDIRTVLNELTVVEREVTVDDGSTYVMHIRLYRTIANVIDGVVLTFFDITQRKQYEQQHAWLAAIVDSTDDAIISQDLDGRVTSWNSAAETIFGVSAHHAVGSDLVELLSGLGSRKSLHAIQPSSEHATPHDSQIRLFRDGQPIDLSLTISPVMDSAGTRVATSIIASDITRRVAEEKQRELLLQELNHRVKNVLAIVQSIMLQTLTDAPPGFKRAFSQRIQGLANSHNLLTQNQWQSVSLYELLEIELRPFGDVEAPRWHASGPPVMLGASQAVPLGMAFHELTTNASKYGSLSSEHGRVIVHWDTFDEHGRDVLRLTWVEQNGARVEQPEKPGFGLRLLKEGLAHQLDARVAIDFAPGGIRCTIEMPLVSDTPEEGHP